MRKENSTFNLHFMSEPGTGMLHNNDYYGCSELDGFACYVVADGLQSGNDKREDVSARLAVDAVIAAFNTNPSIKHGAVTRYLNAAHDALKASNGKKRRRASITVVVTDYQRLRYGYAGNCRFNLYRSGKLIEESKDHSMSWDMMEEGQLQKDKIAYHAERNNLGMYCGTMKSFSPTVSRKIKLRNSDIFSLFTRGIWENADTSDIQKAIQAGENDPKATSDELERLLLDASPLSENIENYTVCFVFVDKVYLDPEAAKRRKRIIIISVIAILVIAIIVVVIILYNNWRERTRNEMQIAYHNGIKYIHGTNFIRAGEELDTAYELAQKLRDNKYKSDINNYKMLVDAIIYADGLFEAKNYEQAMDAYGAATNQSRYADNLAISYIEAQRERAFGFMDVHDYIYLGDTLADIKDWDNAESKYLTARRLASRLQYMEGRKEATDALDAMYQRMQQELEEQLALAQELARTEIGAAEFIIDGDKALLDGDLVAATLFYQMAREKYSEMGNDSVVAFIDRKMELIDVKVTQNEHQLGYAADYVIAGDEMAALGEYIDAKRFYLLAREIYANLGQDQLLSEVQAKIELVDLYLASVPAQAS